VRGYDAPFPDETFKEGARQFPVLVPISPDDPAAPANRGAWEVLGPWDGPFLTAFSDSDPITRGGEELLRQRIPGTRGQPHTTIRNAGHFLQEDNGEELARVVVEFMRATPGRNRVIDIGRSREDPGGRAGRSRAPLRFFGSRCLARV
jgi:haloalkane dehalogenase